MNQKIQFLIGSRIIGPRESAQTTHIILGPHCYCKPFFWFLMSLINLTLLVICSVPNQKSLEDTNLFFLKSKSSLTPTVCLPEYYGLNCVTDPNPADTLVSLRSYENKGFCGSRPQFVVLGCERSPSKLVQGGCLRKLLLGLDLLLKSCKNIWKNQDKVPCSVFFFQG